MQFRQKTIAPAGRNKYGNYMSQGNVTKSVVTTTYAGNDTTTTIGNNGGTEEEPPVYFYCMLSSPNFTFTAVDLANTVSAATEVIAFKGYGRAATYVCDFDNVNAVIDGDRIVSLTPPPDQGIIGRPDGMTITFPNNGTSASTIKFEVNSSLSGDSGSLFIPVQIYKRDDQPPTSGDLYSWYDREYDIVSGETVSTNYMETVWLEYTWYANRASSVSGGTGPQGPAGESAYYLSLTNDNASVNADDNGNVLSGITLPSCQGRLYHGTSVQTGATYRVDWGTASGVSSSRTSTGVLNITLNADFNFEGSSMEIRVSGLTNNTVRDSKVMNIIKSYDGVSYWLETNYSSVIFNPNTNQPTPPAISVSGWKQVGNRTPEQETGATFEYQYHRREGNTFTNVSGFPSTGLTISSADCMSYDRLRVIMKVGSAQKDQEDVDILVDGINGSDGVDGRQGAAIRGPYDYYSVSGSNQCWCAGESGATGCDCEKWLDVVLKDGVYYYCNTSYSNTLVSHFPEYWTSGTSFDFVATRVLLASAASINFLSNNELYLMDENGITGGARGGSGVTFWAGNNEPEDADFKVYTDGTIEAKNGVFGGYIQMRYVDISELQTGGTSNYRKYYLDTRAYVIGYHGTNYYNTLVLPNPSSDLNGFMYSLLIIGHRTSGQHPDENVSCYAEVANGSHAIVDYVYQPYGSRAFEKAGLYGGKYQFVCANVDGSYKWLLTEATGGADMYGTTHGNDETNWRCFRPVFGYNDADGTFPLGGGTPLIKNIVGGTGTDNHTMYIQQ